jgi:hypothetical protein
MKTALFSHSDILMILLFIVSMIYICHQVQATVGTLMNHTPPAAIYQPAHTRQAYDKQPKGKRHQAYWLRFAPTMIG